MKANPIFPLFASIVFLFSCSSDDSTVNPITSGNVNLKIKSVISSTFGKIKNRTEHSRKATIVKIEEFKLSITEVSLLMEDDSTNNDSTDVVLFSGVYQLDLLSNSSPLTETIGDVKVPIGNYEELRFKLHKSSNLASTDPLFKRSVYISGTIDGTPFEMWHDSGENLDLGKSTGVMVDESGINLTVKFDIDQFFLNVSNPIDLGIAEDTDNNNLIEINPDNDGDENEDIAEQLKDNIKEAANLLEE